ncbi:MAG: hypothetical protein JJU02_13080 [Cryomorphaceae bacterium]|nr:hypothetical protein [Cryomorphaceae bacterium]
MNKKAALGIKIGLIIINAMLIYILYESINKPIRFNDIRKERHEVVKKRLEQIRELQVAYRNETGDYADSFDELFLFADTGYVKIEERKDSSFRYYNEVYQQEMNKDTVVVRVIDEVPVKQHLFGKDFDLEKLRYVPYSNRQKEFHIASSNIYRSESRLPTFEVYAKDEWILSDLEEEYGDFFDYDFVLQIGNIAEPSISGNW